LPGVLGVVLLGILGAGPLAARDWEDPAVNRVGTEPPRAVFFPCDSAEQVVSGRPSPWARSLNGKWKFQWSADFDRRPGDFFKPGFDDSAWAVIPVPGCWQMFGHGVPIYTDVRYPFDNDPPRIHRSGGRPVGSYRHVFTVPEAWEGRRVFLRFDGVSSAFTAWLNGEKLGYAEDSRSPSEFDLTGKLHPGANILAVEVLRWCDGSYLEDQDGWRMSGIFREVTLFARPAAHVRDFFVTTDFDGAYRDAVWKVSATVRNLGAKPRDLVLGAELIRGDRPQTVRAADRRIHLVPGAEATVELSCRIESPAKWSAETPNLHRTVLTLKDTEGRILEVVGCPTGFREIEIRDRVLLLNGQPLVIHGVNRVEHDPLFGKTVPRETLLRDLRMMKRANINCIRTAHCPAHPDLYTLCDALGIYVIDEANVESHGIGYGPNSLAKIPEWRMAHVERAVAMVRRDRNHPCVILWSHGNEAGNGPNIVAMNEAVHALDPTRPTHYQFAGRPHCCDTVGGWSRGRSAQKWRRCLAFGDLQRYVDSRDPRPLILNEYCRAMGNAVGNLAEYQAVFDAHPSIAGGCVWDWVDQGLWKTAPFVGRYIAYGGDFGDRPNDGDFCLSGIVFADRTETGKLAECRKVFQPVAFGMPGPRTIRIRNKHSFADTSRYEFVWLWSHDGETKERGTLDVSPIPPGQSATVPMPRFTVRSADGKGEWSLVIEARLRKATPWAGAGYPVASGQFVIDPWNYGRAVALGGERGATPILSLTPKQMAFVAGKQKIVFSRKTGFIDTWEYKGRQLLGAGPEPQFWRAPTANDGRYPVAGRPAKLKSNARFTAQWLACGLDELKDELVSLDHKLVTGRVIVTARHRLASPDGLTVFDATIVHTFDTKGGLLLETEITPSGRQPVSLPRAGLQFRMPRAFERVEWFGRGPGESYPDRKSGMPLGRYSGGIDEQFVNYPVPQENGNKCDVRWFRIETSDGLGLLVTGDRPLNVSVHRYETRDIAMARHTADLRPRGYLVLHLDYAMGPLGNASCGNLPPLPEYQLAPAPMKWKMKFQFVTR
jgi:beta-galactosidase/beta-glucuronidase